MKIDLNADLGESFGPWRMGHDEDILKIVTSANVACGFHAGGPVEMARTCRLCVENGVGVGAHPSVRDLEGFGRRESMDYSPEELRGIVIYQVGALQAIAKSEKTVVGHVKMHGALANMASRNQSIAEILVGAVQELSLKLPILTIAKTCLQRAAEVLLAPHVSEVFADRAYNDDGTLVRRSEAGALVREPSRCADNVLRMVETGTVRSVNGVDVPVCAQTVCVHGDTPEAVSIATAVRERLERAGVEIVRF